jgi:hypothetical protein
VPAPVENRPALSEERFILAALRREDLPQEPVDGERLIRLADWHGVAPLVHTAVTAEQSGRHEAVRERLLQSARRVQRDNMLLLDRLVRLHDLLAEAGLDHLLLKGGALIPLAYESADLRPMADIDLLVRAGDWPRLRAVLGEAGRYDWPGRQQEERRLRYFHKLEISTCETPASVFELHTGLEISGRESLGTDACMERAVEVGFMGRTFRRLCDEDMSFHLVIHAARHFSRPRLIWIHDLHVLAEAGLLNWERLLELARETRSRVAAHFTLSYLEKVFPGTVPPATLAAFSPGPVRRRIFAAYKTQDPLLPTREIWSPRDRWFYAVALLDGPVTMARYLGTHLYRRFVLGAAEE